MNKSVIVHGKQGCGKTINSEMLAEYFGLTSIHDDWDGAQRCNEVDTLILTNLTPEQFSGEKLRRCLSFEEAMRRALS